MDIIVNVVNQKLKVATNLKSFVEGTQEFIRFIFKLSNDWNGLTTFAQFRQNGQAYNVYLDENSAAYLPPEIKHGTCTLILYGTGGTTIGTTNYLDLQINESLLVSDAKSTEISTSLYSQLVNMVSELSDKVERIEKNGVTSELVSEAVQSELNRYLQSGILASMTIANGSISRAKVDTAFEVTLTKADSAMQPNVYDPQGIGSDIYAYTQTRVNSVQNSVNSLQTRVTAMQNSVNSSNAKVEELDDNYIVLEAKVDTLQDSVNSLSNDLGAVNNAVNIVGDSVNIVENRISTLSDSVGVINKNIDNIQSDISASNDRIEENETDLSAIKSEISDAYAVTGTANYSSLGDAIRGVYQLSRQYADNGFNSYVPFELQFVDELPESGEFFTYYLIPNETGTKYDKYWWITDEEGNQKWDVFGGSSTEVVTELPETGESDVDYILNSDDGCLYYKWINGEWQIVAGSLAVVVSELPESGNEFTDYYMANENNEYSHFRYIGGEFHQIGSNSYSKDEIDNKLSELSNTLSNNIDLIDAKVNALGNLVSDITESESGISVYYNDGSSKVVDTKDTTVKVEDVNKSESGLSIIYTDGSTKEIEITGGGGTSTSGSATVIRITASSTQCVYGDECPIAFTFNAFDSAGDIVGDGTATWYVGNVRKTTSIVHQGDNSFDIGPYLSVGSNNVKVSISVDTGGDIPTITTKTWTVNAINMYAVWDYDDTTVNISDTVVIRWTPYGDLSKTTHILIDGEEVVASETTRSGVQQYATINKYPHGSHMVELYLTAMVNGTEIRSDSIFHDMIFVDTNNSTPVIACPVANAEIIQYNTLQLPIVIYYPGYLTTDAVLAANGVEIATWEDIDRTIHYWNYSPNDFGTKTLTITCGETVKTITIIVKELDIDNEEIAGYAFRLKASDIAGNEALRAWNSNGVDITFSDNFDWNNGGIQTEKDENGNIRQYICVKAGTTATINYELFGNEAKANGKNFKVIFKVMNSRDYNAKFLSCLDNGIGVELCANGGTASSGQNTLNIQYAEESYTEFEYDIAPDSNYRYIQTYLDGVLTSTNIYAADDNFTHSKKQKITIGSADCDVYIYMVKAYETYLSMNNHIVNFIADAPNAQEMVARYDRNNVLADSGEISYEKLAKQNPKCRVHLWDIPRMTEGKKDYVTGCSYQQIYNAGDARHQLTASNVTINIQGTSSVDYKASGANTDGNFTEGFTDGNGDHIDTYSMSDNSIGVNYFNTKVNIASCENINNMCVAEWYHRYQPYKTAYRIKNPKSRDCMEHNIGVQFIKDQSHGLFADDNYHMYAICNMGNSKNNSAVFHDVDNPLECCLETKDNNSTHCMMLDPNFDIAALDSESYFEFRYPESPTDDMKQAFIELVRWFANSNPAAHTDEKLSEEVTFEAYTFRGTGQDGEVLAGLTIDKYAGTYTHDTFEYRMAKMLSECEDHLIMDSMVYHYVFIEQHAMVDNVCKNIFWGTEDLVHWHLVKNYDNDTADGNNNTGKLVIPFGSEGYDDLGDGAVFNGRDNVYWRFIYGLYEARQLMWTNRETAGAWNAEAYLAFAKERQDIIPEIVYNQDYWYKYLRLYEQQSVTTYIPMLEGGKKSHQREAFVTNNLYYMAGQYMGTACTSKSITLRGYTPNEWAGVEPKAELKVMLYNKGYIVTQIGSIFQRVKAEKGQYYTIVFSDSGDMNDTVINIHGANLVQAVGDISCLYPGRSDFSAATKLRSLQIGSIAEGYRNNNLTEIGFGTNAMLEYLYIQNCPNVKQTLDLSGCQALMELDIRGSGFTGVTFALGGLINKAQLCSPASLNMRNLYNLMSDNFTLESYDELSSLRLEECPKIDTLALVNHARNLTHLRILGIDWELADTTVLNRLLQLGGLDESNHVIDISVLAGDVYVSGQIREQELKNYDISWENLEVTYDSQNLVTQYIATFVNANGDILYTQYVDRGTAPIDPVATGIIPIPTIDSTAQYDFTYTGWDDVTSVMLANRTITALYSSTTRTYTVKWYSRTGLELASKAVEYGSDVAYQGEIPTRTDEEDTFIYNVFSGWDKSTGYITGDTNVYAVWTRSELPVIGKDLSEMNVAEIYGIATARKADSYLELKDYCDITLGHDFNFTNIESEVLAENLYLDGTTAHNKEIALFGENERSFTIAIDYQFASGSRSNDTLFSCFDPSGSEGLRLRYGTHPNVQWGETSANVGNSNYRDIVVIRHLKGDPNLYVYCSNGTASTTFAKEISFTGLSRSRVTSTDASIVFGAVQFLGDGGYDYYGNGTIHWCKIWYEDLGDTNARKLASWYHENVRLEFAGSDRFRLTGGVSTKANISFVANNLLSGRGYVMNDTNTNVGGWSATRIKEFCDTRLYDALPDKWKSIIKKVEINYWNGETSVDSNNTTYVTEQTEGYVYIPSMVEVGSTDSAYSAEGTPIGWFDSGNVYTRVKFKGITVPDGYSHYTSSADPSTSIGNTVKYGDIWQTSNNSAYYIYVDLDTINMHALAAKNVTSAGGWVSADSWWTRTPTKGYTTYFNHVSTAGNTSLAQANNPHAICIGFSV